MNRWILNLFDHSIVILQITSFPVIPSQIWTISRLRAGFRLDHEASCQIPATFKRTKQNSLCRSTHAKFLHHPASRRMSGLRSRTIQRKRTSVRRRPEYRAPEQPADAFDEAYSHSPLLLEKIRQCFHASRLRWPRVCSLRPRLAHRAERASSSGRS